jgi:hypothetical protein
MTRMKKPEIASPLNANSRIGVIDIERMLTVGEESKSTPNIAKHMAPVDVRIYAKPFALCMHIREAIAPAKNSIIPE